MPFEPCELNALPAFRIAHVTNAADGTGVTAIVAPNGAVGGVAVRGGAPATRETDLLDPANTVQRVHAVMLSGGSAFGLEAACGAMDALAEAGIGFDAVGIPVPIVVGASLFDLPVGAVAYPTKEDGAAAVAAALAGAQVPLARGNVGAGTGATCGKLLGLDRCMKTGLGYACLHMGDVVVGALVAVNAIGNVYDGDTLIAGARGDTGTLVSHEDALAVAAAHLAAQASGSSPADSDGPCRNTTIGCIITNATLTKPEVSRVASVAHDGYAMAIRPVHTSQDGDTVFALASCDIAANADVVGALAAEAMRRAIVDAARSARGDFGIPAACDVQGVLD